MIPRELDVYFQVNLESSQEGFSSYSKQLPSCGLIDIFNPVVDFLQILL